MSQVGTKHQRTAGPTYGAAPTQRGSRSTVAAIEATGLEKTYRGQAGDVEAVRGVDLTVGAGQVFGFLGPNGAGESTTVRMLTTLMTITAGTARVAGTDIAADPHGARRKIGVALQEAGLDPRQNGREIPVLQCRLFGLSKPQAAERAAELLDLVELTESAWTWRRRWRTGRRCSSSTSRPPVWTPRRDSPSGRGPPHQPARHHGLPHPPSTWRKPMPAESGWLASTPG
jgi:ABC-type glutathione transport system ATPase component